jgi:alpha-L-rhamnosidase
MTVCYETISKIAGVLGKSEDAEKYRSRKESVIESINNEFLDIQNSSYASGSQIDLAYPLLAGVVPDTLKEKVTENLLNIIRINNNGHIACGLVGIPVFTEWSVNDNQADLFYSILKKKDYPGYLYMIENGATTTWEHWNGARSRIHNCYNGIGSWFYQALGGIRNDENFPGYRHVIIDPRAPDGVSWAKVTKETPYGPLGVNWIKDGNNFRIELKIPVGCTASVRIPDEIETYMLDGKRFDRGNTFADLKSGSYIIEY